MQSLDTALKDAEGTAGGLGKKGSRGVCADVWRNGGGRRGFLHNVNYVSSKKLSWKNSDTIANVHLQQGNHTLASTLIHILFDGCLMYPIWIDHMILSQTQIHLNLLL